MTQKPYGLTPSPRLSSPIPPAKLVSIPGFALAVLSILTSAPVSRRARPSPAAPQKRGDIQFIRLRMLHGRAARSRKQRRLAHRRGMLMHRRVRLARRSISRKREVARHRHNRLFLACSHLLRLRPHHTRLQGQPSRRLSLLLRARSARKKSSSNTEAATGSNSGSCSASISGAAASSKTPPSNPLSASSISTAGLATATGAASTCNTCRASSTCCAV